MSPSDRRSIHQDLWGFISFCRGCCCCCGTCTAMGCTPCTTTMPLPAVGSCWEPPRLRSRTPENCATCVSRMPHLPWHFATTTATTVLPDLRLPLPAAALLYLHTQGLPREKVTCYRLPHATTAFATVPACRLPACRSTATGLFCVHTTVAHYTPCSLHHHTPLHTCRSCCAFFLLFFSVWNVLPQTALHRLFCIPPYLRRSAVSPAAASPYALHHRRAAHACTMPCAHAPRSRTPRIHSATAPYWFRHHRFCRACALCTVCLLHAPAPRILPTPLLLLCVITDFYHYASCTAFVRFGYCLHCIALPFVLAVADAHAHRSLLLHATAHTTTGSFASPPLLFSGWCCSRSAPPATHLCLLDQFCLLDCRLHTLIGAAPAFSACHITVLHTPAAGSACLLHKSHGQPSPATVSPLHTLPHLIPTTVPTRALFVPPPATTHTHTCFLPPHLPVPFLL